MKKTVLFLFFLLDTHLLFAQWTTSGNSIYNSNSGNVGVGTTYPQAFLDIGNPVIDTLATVLGRLPEGNSIGNGTYLGLRTYNTNVVGIPSFSIEHRFYGLTNSAINFCRGGAEEGGFLTFATNNGTEQMRLDQNGNLGIGTTTPTNRLSVSTTSTGGAVIVAATTSNSIFSGGHALVCNSSLFTGGIAISVGANNSGFIQAYSSTLENGNIFLDPNGGNVGIGTTNPQSLLSVEGIITAKELNITQTNWSDFVFDSAYQRMTLDKVASYVSEHKHLPDIPSAAQIEQGGLDIGAMERLHMQKIEELTLYVIDADKHAQQQDMLISQQQALLLKLQEQLKVQQREIEQLKQQGHQ